MLSEARVRRTIRVFHCQSLWQILGPMCIIPHGTHQLHTKQRPLVSPLLPLPSSHPTGPCSVSAGCCPHGVPSKFSAASSGPPSPIRASLGVSFVFMSPRLRYFCLGADFLEYSALCSAYTHWRVSGVDHENDTVLTTDVYQSGVSLNRCLRGICKQQSAVDMSVVCPLLSYTFNPSNVDAKCHFQGDVRRQQPVYLGREVVPDSNDNMDV